MNNRKRKDVIAIEQPSCISKFAWHGTILTCDFPLNPQTAVKVKGGYKHLVCNDIDEAEQRYPGAVDPQTLLAILARINNGGI